MERYDHQKIEKDAQEKWASLNLYQADLSDETKEPYYLLAEFPYPSGDLHIGHWYAFAVTDIYARVLRAQGKNVLFPIGFDAFGLPAENAAIKHGLDPKEWTYKNMDRMRAQLRSMGASFDWSKEVVTCDPSYYQWTQWLFTKLFEQGLAERKKAAVKWCPKDQTVLANEQVIDGCCERCGTEVEERQLIQWFLKITDYAERLLTDLEPLPWREEIKDAQRAWIGKSDGAKLTFSIPNTDQSVEVFTTRPDTIFGVTYVVLAPEHPLVEALLPKIKNADTVLSYIAETKKKTERERSENKEKTGVVLEGISVLNPATQKTIPVYLADYVLASYGTGAVMAVPAHDERDFEFAIKMQTLPIVNVIDPGDAIHSMPVTILRAAHEGSYENEMVQARKLLHERILSGREYYLGTGTLVNSGEFSGRNSEEAKDDLIAFVGGEKKTQYRLRDWLVSRQRYWGCPIPVVYDPDGKPHAVPSEHLPWILPTDVNVTPNGSEAPLASSKELKERVIKIFGEGWTPEYDTLDTFVDSSWYFSRYLDVKNEHHFSDMAMMKKWLPVNRYSGGSEHTTMHLLYARFFTKALYDLALVPTAEPFIERFNRGLIMGPDGQKMSKSKGNVINPDDVVSELGADSVRTYLAFIGPYNEPGSYPWKPEGVVAMRKFLDRVSRLIERVADDAKTPLSIQRALAQAIQKVTDDSHRFKFNTAIAALMTFLNQLEKEDALSVEVYRNYLILLTPFAPHLCEYLWSTSGGEGSVNNAPWPEPSAELLTHTSIELAVQVNGKLKGLISASPEATEDDVVALARSLPVVEQLLASGAPKRVIYVPGKILNLVVPR